MGNYVLLAVLLSATIVSSTPEMTDDTSPVMFDVLDYGARVDGTDASSAFVAAWGGACQSAVPATVYVPPGTYLLSSLVFTGPCNSYITFLLAGTVVAAQSTWSDPAFSWVTFSGVDGLKMAGGVLDGNGASVWECKNHDVNEGDCFQGAMSLTISNSTGVVIEGVKSVNSSLFHFVVFQSSNITVQGVMAEAPADSVNTDGIHIQMSTAVEIYRSNISTGDDCISVGPGSSHLWIKGIMCGSGHGISIGSLGHQQGLDYESVKNVTVNATVFTGTTNGIRIKTWANSKPGSVNQVTFMHCNMSRVENPILIDQNYCPHNTDCPGQTSSINISDVRYISIYGSSATPIAITFNCSSTYPCSDILLQDVQLSYNDDKEASTAYCENVQGTTAGLVEPKSCFCLHYKVERDVSVLNRCHLGRHAQKELNMVGTGRSTLEYHNNATRIVLL